MRDKEARPSTGTLTGAVRGILALRKENPRETAFQRLRLAEAAAENRSLEIRWRWLARAELPAAAKEAVVFSIDPRFWRHRGVDWPRILECWRRNRREGRPKQGGSTLSMQVVKNLFFSPRRTYRRKAAEAVLAPFMERVLGKERVLEIYLNIAEWGEGVFGIAAAAEFHFGKEARDLTVKETARLVAVLPAPLVWSPVRPPLHARLRAERIRRRLESGSEAAGSRGPTARGAWRDGS